MWKIKTQGGIKLINIQIKSETSKAKWLVDITTHENLKLNRKVFTELFGQQKGDIGGKDLLFLNRSYLITQFKNQSNFYKEGLLALTKLEIRKGIQSLHHWDAEHIFYNPLSTKQNGKTLTLRKHCEEKHIYRYEQLVEEKRKQMDNLPFDKTLTNILDKICVSTQARKNDILVNHKGEEIKFAQITQKLLYEETLFKIQTDHHSQAKWVRKLNDSIQWEEIWNTIHNTLSTNECKNLIWQQIHLNFYTQYSYNKWHKTLEICPLCKKYRKVSITQSYIVSKWTI